MKGRLPGGGGFWRVTCYCSSDSTVEDLFIGKGFEKLENISESGIDQGIFKWRMSGNHAADMGKDTVLSSAPDKKG